MSSLLGSLFGTKPQTQKKQAQQLADQHVGGMSTAAIAAQPQQVADNVANKLVSVGVPPVQAQQAAEAAVVKAQVQQLGGAKTYDERAAIGRDLATKPQTQKKQAQQLADQHVGGMSTAAIAAQPQQVADKVANKLVSVGVPPVQAQQAAEAAVVKAQVQQLGGAKTYEERAAIGRDLATKAQAWRAEVADVRNRMGISFKDALVEASNRRKDTAGYQTVADRRVAAYKPRVAADVSCYGQSKCIGAYDRPGGPRYDGPAIRKTRVTAAGAEKLLRALYHQRGRELGPSDRLKTASARGRAGYRRDKSMVSSKVYEPCPTRTIALANGNTRQIARAPKGHPCRNNWQYASTIKHHLLGHRKRFGGFGDVRGVDDGVKDASYLKGFRVTKLRAAAPVYKGFASPYYGK
jgi:hypothetical protein